MNAVDVVVLAVVLAAAFHGFVVGAVVQTLSFIGTAAGLVGGAALAPTLSRLVNDPSAKAIVGMLCVFGLAALFGGLGRQLGVRVWRRIHTGGLAPVDSGAGALVATTTGLLVAWLIGSMLATVPTRPIASEVQHSAILRALDRALPPAPTVIARVERILDAHGLPQVFAGFEPVAPSRLPLPADPAVRAAVARAGASTVKVVGFGCGGILSGSGFVVAPGLVITNAHVIAGIRRPRVLDRRGSHAATPLLFDPNLDLAVLRVRGLNEPVLSLLAGAVRRGTTGAVLGYPGGGPFDAEPAVVLARIPAVGRNIYGRRLTTRVVYELQSKVRPGNSGGPLVRPDGTVIGVVFSRSSLRSDLGFALTSDEVRPKVAVAERRTRAVGTSSCAAD